jgi:small subunit ribosomal protein S20
MENFKKTTSLLDKLASKRIIHRNKAANKKSRLAQHIQTLS